MGNFDALTKSNVIVDEVSNKASRRYANFSAPCYVITGSYICINTSSSEIKREKWQFFFVHRIGNKSKALYICTLELLRTVPLACIFICELQYISQFFCLRRQLAKI
jgi:hypothetical protein